MPAGRTRASRAEFEIRKDRSICWLDPADKAYQLPIMTLRDRIVAAPVPFEPDNAGDLSAILEGVDPDDARDPLIRGIACNSPYLFGLMMRESAWLQNAWDQGPEQSFHEILDLVRAEPGPRGLPAQLRIAKRRAALLIALCDLGGVWDLLTVTAQLTRFADTVVDTGLKRLMRDRFRLGRLQGLDEAQVERCAGVSVLAMGKMGAGELNYSSDIDLIVISDATDLPPDSVGDLRASFVRITRQLVRLLSDVTRDGYVFRTDLRLRPNPSTTPVCVSSEAALRYYESTGRTWERAALIKARSAAGDVAAGRRFLDQIAPFIWRRHLDFATVDAAHDMQNRIRQHKGLAGPIRLEAHNMKLGPGGIRQIEFFAQTLQLITGGRDPEVREPGTVGALRVLSAKGWIPEETANFLIEAYRQHRILEHRLQMVQDIQTQTLPSDESGMSRIAAFCGYTDEEAFRSDTRERLEEVYRICSQFFERKTPSNGDENADPVDPTLIELSDGWPSLPVLRSPNALPVFERVRPKILSRLTAADDPDLAAARFDGFLRGLPTGVQLFSLFETNPPLLDLLIDVCSNAPGLADYLAKNATVIEALFDPVFFQPMGDRDELVEDLAIVLATTPDYEARLNAARIWMHKKHFQIGVLQLRGIAGVLEAAQSYSDLAVSCVRALLPGVEFQFTSRYGQIPGMGIAVLAMGKLGSAEMTATSDLDLVIVYDAAGQDASSGMKPLAATTYFSRLTQTLVTALSSRMTEGKLYNVDMRLRPSGRQGPVAISLQAFDDYQKNRAWTWEHLALSRSRVIAGHPETMKAVEGVRRSVLLQERDSQSVFADVANMRERIAANRKHDSVWNVKTRPGGLLEIELLAQALALVSNSTDRHPKEQLASAAARGWLGPADLSTLTATHDLLVQVQHVLRLLAHERFEIDRLGAGGQAVLLSLTGRETVDELREHLMTGMSDCEGIVNRTLQC
ncbi:MAG: glutamine-synthetase adenylyltransferase [Paracoccaceae bacterium]|nr:glutamine-synthetase adenylyltransferase [Paracoccaceae bacterium]